MKDFEWFNEKVIDGNGISFLKSKYSTFSFPLYHPNNSCSINFNFYSNDEIYLNLFFSVKDYYSDGNFNSLKLRIMDFGNKSIELETNNVSIQKSELSNDQWILEKVVYKFRIQKVNLDFLVSLKNGRIIIGNNDKFFDEEQYVLKLEKVSPFFILIGSYNDIYGTNFDKDNILEKLSEIKKSTYFLSKYLSSFSRFYEFKYPTIKDIEIFKIETLTESFKQLNLNDFIIYVDSNIENIKVQMKNRTENENIKIKSNSNNKSNKNCFIVTTTMGDINHPVVLDFRRYRDEVLLNSYFGRVFINIYYRIGPVLSKVIKTNSFLFTISKNIVLRLHKRLRIK